MSRKENHLLASTLFSRENTDVRSRHDKLLISTPVIATPTASATSNRTSIGARTNSSLQREFEDFPKSSLCEFVTCTGRYLIKSEVDDLVST